MVSAAAAGRSVGAETAARGVPAHRQLLLTPLVPRAPFPTSFLSAIRFVFGDQFGAMRADDKTKLIFVRVG